MSRRDGHDTTRSPPRRSTERDNYDNLSDNDDRSSDRRQRDNNDSNKRGCSSGRGGSGSFLYTYQIICNFSEIIVNN